MIYGRRSFYPIEHASDNFNRIYYYTILMSTPASMYWLYETKKN